MPNESLPSARTAHSPEAKANPLRQETAALAGGLERIRATVMERLDHVEAAVRARIGHAPAGEPELIERDKDIRKRTAELQQRAAEIQQRAAEIDDAQRRLRTDRERWENERTAMLEQLEHDRRLLAEAWERLERDKLEHPGASPASPQNGAGERPAVKVMRAVVASDDENPVAQAILRQFEAVRRDVRRNANGPAAS